MIDLFSDHTYVMALAGSTVIGVVAGALGSFAYLRRQSMIADVISHSALPGTLGAFLLLTALGYDGRNLFGLMVGAIIVGTISVALTNWIPRLSVVKLDAAMAVVLSSFFGLGMLLMQYIQNNPIPNKGGLNDYLFGNASSITKADLLVSTVVGGVALAIIVVFFKEFTAQSFDRQFVHVLGLNNSLIDALLFALITIATVIGLKAVGLVLMVAFVVTPPAIARQWTSTTRAMVALAGAIGGISSAVGTYLSIYFGPMPTGPVIVVVLFLGLVLSLGLSPRRRIAQAVA